MNNEINFSQESKKPFTRREMSVEESLENHRRVLAEFDGDPWSQLSPGEKALCLNYKRQLLAGMSVENALIIKVNEIHGKYADFDIGCVP